MWLTSSSDLYSTYMTTERAKFRAASIRADAADKRVELLQDRENDLYREIGKLRRLVRCYQRAIEAAGITLSADTSFMIVKKDELERISTERLDGYNDRHRDACPKRGCCRTCDRNC